MPQQYRLFISHKSEDLAWALALSAWLTDNGWEDHFLDDDPQRGLVPGDRWEAELRRSLQNCEAVLCLISRAWCRSQWCVLEAMHAEWMGLPVIGLVIDPQARAEPLAVRMAQQRQLADLTDAVADTGEPAGQATTPSLPVEGMQRLRFALQRLGLQARMLPWTGEREPYPGLAALTEDDGAIFYGRDGAIARAMVQLRQMAQQQDEKPRPLLVILGSSGAGKSSFLRAGLLSRLRMQTDDFVVFPACRPGDDVLAALAEALSSALTPCRVRIPRAEVRKSLDGNGLAGLLRQVDLPATAVMAIDQFEELFDRNRRASDNLLRQLPDVLGSGRALVVVAIRSDRFNDLQRAAAEFGIELQPFSLAPLATTEFRAVIEGPARRSTEAGVPIELEDELKDTLVRETRGTNALPLLAHVLRRLYDDYGGPRPIIIDHYKTLGGMGGALQSSIERVLSEPRGDPPIPGDRTEQLALLRRCFIPWLAAVSVDTGMAQRRVARRQEFAKIDGANAMIDRLVRERLLTLDGVNEQIDIAHEALLTEWSPLRDWLEEDRAALTRLAEVLRAAAAWERSQRLVDLQHLGERLREVSRLAARMTMRRALQNQAGDYLRACRAEQRRLRGERVEQTANLVTAAAMAEAALSPSLALAALAACAAAAPNALRPVAGLASLARRAVPTEVRQLVWKESADSFPRRDVQGTAESLFRAERGPRSLVERILGRRSAMVLPDGHIGWLNLDSSMIAVVKADHSSVSTLASSGPAGSLCSGGGDGVIRLWDSATLKLLRHHETAHEVTASWVSRCGRFVFAGNCGGHVLWWGPDGAVRTHELRQFVRALASTQGDRMVAVVTGSESGGSLHLFDAHSGEPLLKRKLPGMSRVLCSNAEDAGFVVAIGAELVEFDTAGRRSRRRWSQPDSIAGVAVDVQHRLMVAYGRGQWLSLRMGDRQYTDCRPPLSSDVAGVTTDGGWVVAWSERTIAAFDANPENADPARASNWHVLSSEFRAGSVAGVALDGPGRHVAWVTKNFVLSQASLPPGSLLQLCLQEPTPIQTFDVRDSQVAAGFYDGRVRLGAVVLQSRTESKDRVRFVRFSPDGSCLASLDDDGWLHVWLTDSGSELWSRQLPDFQAGRCIVWSESDPGLIAVTSWTGAVAVFSAAKGELVRRTNLGSRICGEAFETGARALVVLTPSGTCYRVDVTRTENASWSASGVELDESVLIRGSAQAFYACTKEGELLRLPFHSTASTVSMGPLGQGKFDVSPDGSAAVLVNFSGIRGLCKRHGSFKVAEGQGPFEEVCFVDGGRSIAVLDGGREHVSIIEFAPDGVEQMRIEIPEAPFAARLSMRPDTLGHLLLCSDSHRELWRVPVSREALLRRARQISRRTLSAADRRQVGLDLLKQSTSTHVVANE